MVGALQSPRDRRTAHDWNDNAIDYSLFDAKGLANSPSTIRGKIPSVRFRHFLVGVPDFALGGGGASMC